jgi:hypothetical protein
MLNRKKVQGAKESGIWGNIVSEYIGVYFMILAIPLVVNLISLNPYLRAGAFIFDMLGLIVYHLSGFSIMEQNFERQNEKDGKYHYVFMAIIIFLEYLLVYFQVNMPELYRDQLGVSAFEITAIALTVFIFSLAFVACLMESKKLKPVQKVVGELE